MLRRRQNQDVRCWHLLFGQTRGSAPTVGSNAFVPLRSFHFSLFTSRLRGYQSSTLPGYASRALRSTTRACSMSSFFKT